MVVIETPSSSQTCPGEGACITQWATPCRATQDGQVIVKSSDKMWSPGGGGGKPLQYSCQENLMNSTKRQKGMSPEDEPSKLEGVQYATGEEQRAITNSSRKDEAAGPKRKWCSVVVVSGGESKVQCCKEWYCRGTWKVRSMNQGLTHWKRPWCWERLKATGERGGRVWNG